MRWGRRSRNQLTAITDQLFIPQPFDLNQFCAAIAEQRGRPLMLLPLDGPPNPDLPCGIWIGLDAADLVFYETMAADVLKVQIVLHEIGHMLLGHEAPELEIAGDVTQEELATASEHLERILARTTHVVDEIDAPALPIAAVLRAEAARLRAATSRGKPSDAAMGLSASRIAQLLGRTRFTSKQEKDAETLGTLILERASRNDTGATSHEAADVLGRLHDAFGHPVRK
ncbi:hypothetical protein ACH4UM_04335 [Streptomyces sp. NPDC020801]|uniref:hypothetical protein n=1 Tax=Streptomyces sp. NPDC020801 TaxID=3365093 RepID=UPI0037911D98